MAIKTLKRFQEQAIDSAVAVFDYARTMLDAVGDDVEGRATAIHDNGYILIEAPTGSGKTLMAGHIVERMSAADNVVWFWFAPFKGVVDQSAAFLREQFTGLRLRTLGEDRNAIGSKSGDVFVTTWQMVATRIVDRRSVRQTSEQNESIDELVKSLRDMGLRIGVVVDEAHHGFHGETQAAAFFRTILAPEYTILITATPDDADLRDLQERMQIGNVHRISVSRADAVGAGPGAGLIKHGVRAIAWRAEEGTETLVDFETAALREGTLIHQALKGSLTEAGIKLVPLMLVQVEGTGKPVQRAKEKLIELGFREDQIAVHTSKEPDPHLLAVADNENIEALVFVMAVALGFDAPRAWTLVSMRAARDADFGVQLVGRILRVHRRLQGKVLPEALKYGYVLLADMESQGGLDAAGQKINQIRTAYSSITPTTIVAQVGNRTFIQSVGPDGQLTMLPAPPAGAIFAPPPTPDDGSEPSHDGAQALLFASATAPEEARAILRAVFGTPPPEMPYRYVLRPDVPRQFQTYIIAPDREVTEEDCAEHFAVSAAELFDAIVSRESVRVQKRTLEIFTREIQMEMAFAPPSLDEMQRAAQRVILAERGILNPKVLRHELLRRMQAMLLEKGVADATDWARLDEYLNILLVQHPTLLRDARKKALVAAAEIRAADELPETIDSLGPLPTSRCNAYGVVPADMNQWERDFGEHLDADDTGTVLWWHRNPKQRPWSINVLLDDGRGFYPDFIVGIQARPTRDNGLLADTKYAYQTQKELPKLLAEHADYGRVLILTKSPSRKWILTRRDERTGAGLPGPPFRLADARQY